MFADGRVIVGRVCFHNERAWAMAIARWNGDRPACASDTNAPVRYWRLVPDCDTDVGAILMLLLSARPGNAHCGIKGARRRAGRMWVVYAFQMEFLAKAAGGFSECSKSGDNCQEY